MFLLTARGDEDHRTTLGLVIDVTHQCISHIFLQVPISPPDCLTDQLAYPRQQHIRITDNDKAARNDLWLFS
jgi:hypothetical protein